MQAVQANALPVQGAQVSKKQRQVLATAGIAAALAVLGDHLLKPLVGRKMKI